MTHVTPISPYASPLVEVLKAQGPTTIVCGPHSRDDVISAIAPFGPYLGVEVVTLEMAITHGAKNLSPRKPLTHAAVASQVAALMSDGATPTVFHSKQLNNEAVTRESLTNSITTVLNLPREWREPARGADLPHVVYELAVQVEDNLKHEFFTRPEAVEATTKALASRTVIVAGPIGFDPFTTWALEQLSPDHVFTLSVDSVAQYHSFVSEVDEASFIARTIVDKVEQGVALHKIAIGSCTEESLPFITQALDKAGVPYSGPTNTTWLENPSLRAIALLLRIDPAKMLRTDLVNLLETGKVRGDSPSLVAFDIITRNSSETYYSGKDWDQPEPEGLSEKKSSMWNKTLAWVKHVREQLFKVWDSGSWESASDQLAALIKEDLAGFIGAEKVMVDELLALLSGMSGPVSRELAVEVVHNFLETAQPQVKDGLLKVGLLDKLAGRNLSVAFVCGATDKALPGSISIDPSITQHQLRLTSADFLRHRRAAFTAAANSAAEVIYTYPRSHADGSGKAEPSLWTGGTFTRHGPAYLNVAAGELTPLNAEEVDTLKAAVSGDSTYATISSARKGGKANEFNGFIATDLGKKFFEKDVSNSALENFANSPLTFFISRVLGQGVLESPEALMDVEPREAGNFYHAIFEEWTNRVWLHASPRPRSAAEIDWDKAFETLMDIAHHRLELLHSGTISTSVARRFSDNALKAITEWFEVEKADAVDGGWIPLGAELKFGYNRHAKTHDVPLTIDLLNGQRITLTGSIDRFDYRFNQSKERYELRVTDYKSSKTPYKITQEFPTGAKPDKTGTSQSPYRFQLALYGEAVRQAISPQAPTGLLGNLGTQFQGKNVVIQARFWHFLPQAKEPYKEIEITDAVHETLLDQLTAIHEMITSGQFPATPQERRYLFEERLRLGHSNYDTIAEGFAEQALVPLTLSYVHDEEEGK